MLSNYEIGNLGANLQKLAHLSKSHAIPIVRHPLWIGGLGCMILAAIGDFIALGLGPQSIIAPLGSVTLVANIFIAPFLVGETVKLRDFFSTFLIGLGCTFAVVFADHTQEDMTPMEIYAFFWTQSFLIYAICAGSIITFLILRKRHCDKHRTERTPEYMKLQKQHRFIVPALSGMVGAQNVLLAKCTCTLFLLLLEGDTSVLAHYETYIFIIGLGITITFQVKWLNDALSKFESTYVVPVFQTFWIGISVISGLMVYEEYKNMGFLEMFMFLFGTILTIIGVIWLSKRKMTTTHRSASIAYHDQPLLPAEDSYESLEGSFRLLSIS